MPNALHFIDKYNQVPRILNPMVLAIEGIDRIARDPFIYKYIENAFGGINTLKKSNYHRLFRSVYTLPRSCFFTWFIVCARTDGSHLGGLF